MTPNETNGSLKQTNKQTKKKPYYTPYLSATFSWTFKNRKAKRPEAWGPDGM